MGSKGTAVGWSIHIGACTQLMLKKGLKGQLLYFIAILQLKRSNGFRTIHAKLVEV